MAPRRRPTVVVGLVVCAVAALAGAGVACSGPRVVDRTKLEQGIIDQSSSGAVTITSVSCPEGRRVREGDTFTCQATLSTGQPVTVEVTQTNGDGGVTFTQVEAVITGEQFAASENGVISAEYGVTVMLECPALIVVEDGDTFTCQGTDDRGHTRTVTFTAVHPHEGEFTHVVEGLPPPSTTTTSGG
ncbi:MAG: DUF4333 domain-containing protein [Acidimicrobiales bacterium]